MASIRKRNGRWQTQVRVKGSPPLTRSFLSKADAQSWGRKTEGEADRRGLPSGLKVLDSLTVGDILLRYLDEVTPSKRGAVREGMAVRALLRHSLAKVPLSAITVAQVAHHRDLRLQTVKPSSINRELAIYRHAFEVARKVWDVPLRENPFALVQKPQVSDSRSRRLERGEWKILKEACLRSRNPYIYPMVEFCLETAMRRGEVLALRWCDVNVSKRTLHIPRAKNGHARTIPVTLRALEIINEQRSGLINSDARIFPTTEDALKMAWRRVMLRCSLPDFRWHDCRHEAISRFFEMGLSTAEVAVISGHKDFKLLFRYTHLRPEDIAEKISKIV